MKRVLFVCMLITLAVAGIAQESDSDVMYIYRNDGDFNAFFFSEVDSITYSNYGADGIAHEDIDVQVIWTKDSVYRIPVEVIDSITFQAPDPVYQSDVVIMTKEWLEHIVAVEDMQIMFAPTITQIWTPILGVVLYYGDFDEIFPNGFAGRVSNIDVQGNYIVTCETVSLDEIWEELIVAASFDVIEEENTNGEVVHRLRKHNKQDDDTQSSISISWDKGPLSLEGNTSYTIKSNLYIKDGSFTYDFKYDYSMSGNVSLSTSESVIEHEYNVDLVNLSNIPIPPNVLLTPLRLDLKFGPQITLEIEAEVSLAYGFEVSGYTSMKCQNGVWSKNQSQTPIKHSPSIEGGLSGSLEVGLRGEATVRAVGNMLSFSAELSAGVGIECDFSADLLAAMSGEGAYAACKDMTVDAYSYLGFDVNAQINVFALNITWAKPVFSFTNPIGHWYLFPEFSGIECESTKDYITLTSNVSRETLMPLQVGYRLYKNDNIIYNGYQSQQHQSGNTKLTLDVTKSILNTNEPYQVAPIFKFFNWDIAAAPEKVITVIEDESGLCLADEDENVVFFKKPGKWSSSIYCYLSDSYSGAWPGIPATSIGNGYYKVELGNNVPPEGNLIIWSVGGTQCNGDPQTNDLTFSNRVLYTISGSATNPNYNGGMNFAEGEDCDASPTLPTCSKTPVTELCYQCECGQ